MLTYIKNGRVNLSWSKSGRWKRWYHLCCDDVIQDRQDVAYITDVWSRPSSAGTHGHTDTHTYTYIHMHVCTHTHTHVCTHAHACTRIHMYARTHTHACTHTHLHTQTCSMFLFTAILISKLSKDFSTLHLSHSINKGSSRVRSVFIVWIFKWYLGTLLILVVCSYEP